MSNFIPFVSSSPPPMDDSQSFGWEDEDDFGNFACAPGVEVAVNEHSNTGESNPSDSNFNVDWSQAGSDVLSETTQTFPSQDKITQDKITPTQDVDQNKIGVKEMNGQSTPESLKSSSPSKSGSEFAEEVINPHCDTVNDNDLNEDDNFADFTAFQDDSSNKNKPLVGSLPLQETNHEDMKISDNCGTDSKEKVVETAMEKSRESTTDSGLFSTDMSPLTKSESFSISEGDRILQSEDETFTDLPHDTEFKSPQNELIERKVDVSDSQSLTPSEDSADMSVLGGGDSSVQCNEQAEHGENGVSEENTPSDEKKEVDTLTVSSDQLDSQYQCSNLSGEAKDSTNSKSKTDQNAEAETAAEPETGSTFQPHAPEVITVEDSTSKDLPFEEAVEDNDDWAAFQTVDTPPLIDSKISDSTQGAEPEDLVLRTNSVEFEEDSSEIDNELGNLCETINTVESNNTSPSHLVQDTSPVSNDFENDDELGDLSEQPFHCKTSSAEETNQEPNNQVAENVACVDSCEDNFGTSSSNESAKLTRGNEVEEDVRDFTANDDAQNKSKEGNDFGEFSSKLTTQDDTEWSEFGDLSSREVTCTVNNEDVDDDFGDFSSQPSSSSAVVESSHTADFGAFSNNSTHAGNYDDDDDDDFGDFSSQPGSTTAAQDSGWANFAGHPNTEAEEEDFGHFPSSKQSVDQESLAASDSSSRLQDTTQGKTCKFEAAMLACFPVHMAQTYSSKEHVDNDQTAKNDNSDADSMFGMLETILQYGLRFQSASQQTWQVVQHPSKNDSRVKLWNHLKDVDGSPAVVYQWAKSHTNSHLFDTLHIDTQNMLIGHKKVSVPIFATGLSLLEPIRGGGRENRMLGVGGQPPKGSSPTLVDPGQQNTEHSMQEIPAVDFDWSTSGLTNPLTSKSLDLDFLVVQDNDASEKLSVFQSEILDAPRSNVKSSQPLEDILKSVKPTSVRSRRDNAATSQMSAEALRVLAGLPDLSFMHSKVLMFPIKN